MCPRLLQLDARHPCPGGQSSVSWRPVIRVLWTHSAIFSIIVLLSLFLGVFLLYEIGCDAWEDVFVN
jgi:hypothetical protein